MVKLDDIKYLKIYTVQVFISDSINPKTIHICAPTASSAKKLARAYIGESMRAQNKWKPYKVFAANDGNYTRALVHQDMVIDIANKLNLQKT